MLGFSTFAIFPCNDYFVADILIIVVLVFDNGVGDFGYFPI